MRRLPLLPTLGLVALGLVLRGRQALRLVQPAEPRPLFELPLGQPPLLDLVTLPFAEHRVVVALLGGLVTLPMVARLASRGLAAGPALVVLALAAVAPPLVFAGSWWAPPNLTVPLALGTALLLVAVLDQGPTPARTVGLGVLGFLLAAADWAGMVPLLAWTAWLVLYRPWWLERERAWAAAKPLAAASALTLLGWTGMMLAGSDPRLALGTEALPRGLDAVVMHVDSLASLVLGRVHMFPVAVRVVLAGATLALLVRGWRRAVPRDRPPASSWGSVLLWGSLGAFGIALLLHPWIPVAVEKSLWFVSPLVICLLVAGLAPKRGLTPLLAVFLVGCVDVDGDGVPAGEDCDDNNELVAPGQPDVWQDGLDNDCDGAVDSASSYRFLDEAEPNDAGLSACFAPEGQDLGTLAPAGELNRVTGVISDIVDASYAEGDMDCFALRLPERDARARLELRLSWSDTESDLDFAVSGLWEGGQSSFAQADASGAGPEIAVTSASFPGGDPLWVWVIGYAGPPTDYTLDLLLRENSESEESE